MYILLALLIFGALIFIHELGHFLAARAFGVTVLEFSIGMGPKIFSVKSKKSGTLYALRLFPIGGYVNMLGENPTEAKESAKHSDEDDLLILSKKTSGLDRAIADADAEDFDRHAFSRQSAWKRILISFAGPMMNILLGWILMLVLVLSIGQSGLGTTEVSRFYVVYTSEVSHDGLLYGDMLYELNESPLTGFSELKEHENETVTLSVIRQNEEGVGEEIILTQVKLGDFLIDECFVYSPSEKSGLMVGDEIKRVGNVSVHTYNELAYEISNQGSLPLDLTVNRNGETLLISDIRFPSSLDEESNIVFGDMDFLVKGEEKFDFETILKHTFFRTLSTVKMVFDSLKGILSGRFGVNSVSGPVGITKTISTVAKVSYTQLLFLVILISVNLGVVNLLPFPALDGFHIFLYLIEWVRGKPVKPEVEAFVNFFGLIFLLLLAVLITVKDVIAL